MENRPALYIYVYDEDVQTPQPQRETETPKTPELNKSKSRGQEGKEDGKGKSKEIEKLLFNAFTKTNFMQKTILDGIRNTFADFAKPSLKVLINGDAYTLKKDDGVLPVLPKSLRCELLCKIETALAADTSFPVTKKYTPETIGKVRQAFFLTVVKLFMTY